MTVSVLNAILLYADKHPILHEEINNLKHAYPYVTEEMELKLKQMNSKSNTLPLHVLYCTPTNVYTNAHIYKP